MTKADAAKLVAIVVTAYPNYDKFKDEAAVTATVSLWATMFQADDGRIVALALNKHIATSKWPPSVAEIRELMLELQHPELIPPEQAWLAVSDLLYTSGEYNYGDLYGRLTQEQIDSLTEHTFMDKKVTESMCKAGGDGCPIREAGRNARPRKGENDA